MVRRADGLAVFATGLPLRLFNQVTIDDAGTVTPGAIATAVAELRARGARFVVTCARGIDDAHVPTVLALGLQPLSPEPWMPGMALHPVPAAGGTPAPAELDIRRVTDAAGVGRPPGGCRGRVRHARRVARVVDHGRDGDPSRRGPVRRLRRRAGGRERSGRPVGRTIGCTPSRRSRMRAVVATARP